MVAFLEVIGTISLALLLWNMLVEFQNGGTRAVVSQLLHKFVSLPGVNTLVSAYIKDEVVGFVNKMFTDDAVKRSVTVSIPEKGLPYEQVMQELKELKEGEADIGNKVFAYKYMLDPDGKMQKLQEEAIMMFSEQHDVSANHQQLVEISQAMFMNENALNPVAFPSLRKFELECISMTASMLNADSRACGSLTSGGTESVLMAVKAYRDMARKYKPHIKNPEILAPISIHPAFEKAAMYFGLNVVHTELTAKYAADVDKLEQGITSNTIMLAASAPSYPHGIIDPIEAIGKLALKHNLPFHVDACYGGFMLPWLDKLGMDIPRFDFRCDGVTSMSADLHKFGYTPKGASIVVYKTEEIRKHQLFTYNAWPGGLFGSTTMAGTRSGAAMAAAWVTLKHLGQDGYMKIAQKLQDTVKILIDGANSIKGIEVIGRPVMNCFAIRSTTEQLHILVVADEMEKKGWRMERQQLPDSIHFSILPQHIGQEKTLLESLSAACQASWDVKPKAGQAAAMYGMIAKIPDQTIVDDFVKEYFSKVYM
ncbi:sphingosine-1-phosphate lyase-like isoform X2 [Watersipora subatra]